MPKKNHSPGITYILSNPEYKGKLKIGFTTGDLMKRVENLSRATGVLGEFKVEWQMEVDSVGIAEEVIFYLLKDYRIKNNKEFFEISLNKAITACKHVSEAIFDSKVIRPKYTKAHWDKIISSMPHPFMKKAVRLCLKEGKIGEPPKKRFGSVRYKFKGFNLISIWFRKDHISIYTHIEKPKGEKLIKKSFPKTKFGDIKLKEWGKKKTGGYSFQIYDEKQFNALVKWMELGRKKKS